MSKKGSLREFQTYLATRFADAGNQHAAGLLGMQAGNDHWVLRLSDSGEIVPLPPLTPVPLTKPWFAGIANIRGDLYSVADFSAFQGKETTPQNASSRLLLIGRRYGSNVALLVTRMLGLRKLESLQSVPVEPGAPAWGDEAYIDHEGQRWRKLNVRALLADESFMQIGA